jgi:hypothetical protein
MADQSLDSGAQCYSLERLDNQVAEAGLAVGIALALSQGVGRMS